MLLRHISPRSTDWMDAMDEGSGGRGWEKLAPEEQAKLLRERPRSQSGGYARSLAEAGATESGSGTHRPVERATSVCCGQRNRANEG